MVTSNKLLDKKVVKMSEQNNSTVIPQRTLLGEVNEHITCPLCRGYYVDATTIVECLHSFCRSCIIKHLQVKSYCPVCEMMINSAKPNIKLDKALQDIVYKLVPGLFQKEMERRQQFYSSRPGPAASATPEQRGEDTERIIFSPEDVISFSLEYADATDTDSISSKSSDSNEPQPPTGTTRRFLQCPAVVNISHLKKFLSMKFDIDSTQFAIDILYKRVPLPDYYTLMDIAYIYNWKRNEPMRFFYQIIDYVAIRNRLFDINRKGSHFRDRKSSPTPTEDTNASSPAPNLNDQGSEISSGTDSPMPEENNGKKSHSASTIENKSQSSKDNTTQDKAGSDNTSTSKKNDDEVEKSQFLNSFELTAKSNSQSIKSSPVKTNAQDTSTSSSSNNETPKTQDAPKVDDNLKRKQQTPPKPPEIKRLKIELEKAKIPQNLNKQPNLSSVSSPGASESLKSGNAFDNLIKTKENDSKPSSQPVKNTSPSTATKELKTPTVVSKQMPESPGIKRTVPTATNISSPKRKASNDPVPSVQLASQTKTVSPLKLQVPKMDAQQFSVPKPAEVPKPQLKRMPDLKPTVPSSQASQIKGQPINKLRMDLLANNSDPTIDRSKILSQVKSSLSAAHTAGQSSGDPLKSLLLDSCKINIPSSLSITLTDQKLDPRSPSEPTTSDPKKNITNKNLVSATTGTAHKVPSPPVHNYIEILKLPDSNPKKQQMKLETNPELKQSPQPKPEGTASPKPASKPSESSAKGPIPNLKPIADTKLGKQSGNFASPITFQQTFEKQLQSLQSDKKTKLPKTKGQVPKLVPATAKTFNTMNKLNNPNNKPPSSGSMTPENKPGAALDLTTPHNIQSQTTSQHPNQSRLLEKMQSIANLAAIKQNPPSKGLPASISQGNVYSPISNRPAGSVPSPLRIPASTMNQAKQDKSSPIGSQATNVRQDMTNKPFQMNQTSSGNSIMSPNYHGQAHNSPTTAQPSPRSQTRSPSSSPKLVIAEDKQASSSSEQTANQSNQISSSQLPNLNSLKTESPKVTPGPSKPGPKPMKPLSSALKLSGIRQPITPNLKPNTGMSIPTDYMTSPQLIAQHPMMPHFRHQMEMQNWYKAKQFDLLKSMANAVHQNQHDFNNKEK